MNGWTFIFGVIVGGVLTNVVYYLNFKAWRML